MRTTGIDPLAALLRGFAVDFLTAHDLGAVARIMTPDYRLHIGGHVFAGRDEQYLPATAAQLEQFPGLVVSVHDVVLGEDALAMRFTEHGASIRDSGRVAAWRGVTLFRTDGGRLRTGWAEEDYFARKRQLASGICDPIEPQHSAPWDIRQQPADPVAEESARAWILDTHAVADRPPAGTSATTDPDPATLLDIEATSIDELFSAGPRVAFHATHEGRYAGGLAGIDADRIGTRATLRAAGLLTVRAGAVVEARIFADRLGLHRSLLRR